MRCAGEDHFGLRLQALIVLMWRAGLRISEALALNEGDLDLDRGAVLVRRGKGGHRREVGMDECVHAVEMAREGVPLKVIQRQLGHANLGVTSSYLHGIDTAEIVDTVHARPAPVLPASSAWRS